jgi:hypothetical protein
MTTLLQFVHGRAGSRRRFQGVSSANGFAKAKRKADRVLPVTEAMLTPRQGAGKALLMPRRSVFGVGAAQKPPESAIYRAISRLEPESNLGQKGAVPMPAKRQRAGK